MWWLIFVLFGAWLICDVARYSTLKSYANENGIHGYRSIVFWNSPQTKNLLETLPDGPLRNRLKLIRATSFAVKLAIVAILLTTRLLHLKW